MSIGCRPDLAQMTNLPFNPLFLLASKLLRESPQRHLPQAYRIASSSSQALVLISTKDFSVSNSSTSAAMAQHSDEVDRLLRAIMPQAPEVLHHVFALEGKSIGLFLFSRMPDAKSRRQRGPAGTEHSRE